MTADATTRDRIDLAGQWQLAFDPDGEGARNGWTHGSWPDDRTNHVQVPSLWNLTHPDAEGAGYYRTVVDLPDRWAGQIVRLHVGGASYRTEAWLNGHFVGSHEGAYTAFRFDVTAAARPGASNELVLRVTSLSRTRLVDGMALKAMPVSKQSWYYAEGGLWGDVWFEAVPPLSCQSITVEPDLRQEAARIEVRVANAASESRHVELALTVTGPRGEEAAGWREPVAVPPGTSGHLVEVKLPRPLAWSCEEPNLYRVRAALIEGARAVDELTANFGMRDFTVRDGRFFLNDNPVYLRGVLLQPNYPVGLIAPHDPGMIEREILLAKEAGFNLIRVHIRPSVPGYFDLTDRHGMLVYAESSLCWIQDTPRLLDHGRREITAMIERDRNHPSVVFWGIFNEHRAPAARYADALIRTARSLDPTRVIVDNSGGTLAMDQDYGWADRATAVPNRETTRVPLHDIHLYIGAPVTRAACD
ncbi:MAG: beta-galactosidase, partial [Thermomicrobiales bacterium]|nr:beta-galactosidase [Thermomicrobiales bacterium]